MFERISGTFIFGPGPRFDHITHRRAGRSLVLESSCTKRLSLRPGLAYQWRTLYGFNVFDNNIRYAYVSKMFDKRIAQLMHHSVKMFGCRSGSRFCRP